MPTPGGVDVSIVVPAYRAETTLAACVAALLDQQFDGAYEVLVCASADDDAGLPRLEPDPSLTLITRTPRLSARDARHVAIDQARGAYLAFTDADAIVAPTWLHELVAASGGGTKIVGGAVVNGTPSSWSGTAEYIAEFSDLAPARPPAGAWHGALCNLLVPRELWDRFGPFATLVGGHDTAITTRARAAHAYVFAPRAQVTHLNRTGARAVIRHQRQLGAWAAHVARSGVPYRGGFLVRHTALAPVAALARLGAAEVRAMRWLRGQRLRSLALAPFLVVLFAAWGKGLFVEGRRLDRERRADPRSGD